MKKGLILLLFFISNYCLGQTIFREWKLVKIYDTQTGFEMLTEPEHYATVAFGYTEYYGNTGCNSYGAKLKYTNEKIYCEAPETTKKYAEDAEKRLVEKYLLDCFQEGEVSYHIFQDTLQLTTKNLTLSFH